ncbi:MAG: serine hydrolase, partial [Actinobacteria bacterium]|nr:serine hydrolase [Actinomycetota bacterium]
GYPLARPGTGSQEIPTAFGYGGVGGSYAYVDTATGVAFALTKNRLAADFAAAGQIDEIVTKVVAES